jgi:hypothetical protein
VQAELKWCETFRKLTQAAVRVVPFKRSEHNSFCVLYRRDPDCRDSVLGRRISLIDLLNSRITHWDFTELGLLQNQHYGVEVRSEKRSGDAKPLEILGLEQLIEFGFKLSHFIGWYSYDLNSHGVLFFD